MNEKDEKVGTFTDEELKRKPKSTTPLDGAMVLVDWWCSICGQEWKGWIDQGKLRRMPSHVKVNGRRVETRLENGYIMRAHEDCAKRMLRYLEEKERNVNPKKRNVFK